MRGFGRLVVSSAFAAMISGAGLTGMAMADAEKLMKRWIEQREENTADRVVFRPAGYDLPPARGRRALDLSTADKAVARVPGPTDRPESQLGTWSVDGNTLTLAVGPWHGQFPIEELTSDKLVISLK